MNFSTALTVVMSVKGITPQELSDLTGVHLSTISRFRSGTRDPRLKDVDLIAHAFGMSCSALIKLAEKKDWILQ